MKPIDFTPQWYRRGLEISRARRRRLSYVGATVILMGAWLLINQGRIQLAQAALSETRHDYKDAQGRKAELEQLQEQRDAIRSQLHRFEEISSGFPKRFLFSEISYRIPDGVRLADFKMQKIDETQKPKDRRNTRLRSRSFVAPENLEYSDLMVTFRAQAKDTQALGDFVENLLDSRLFERVDHKATNQVSGSTLKEKHIAVYVLRTEHIGS